MLNCFIALDCIGLHLAKIYIASPLIGRNLVRKKITLIHT